MKGKSIAPLLLRRLKGMAQWRNIAPIAFPESRPIAPEQAGAIVRNCAQCSLDTNNTMAKTAKTLAIVVFD